MGGHHRRDRAALPAHHVNRDGGRAGADPAVAEQLLRADGDRADGRHHGRDRVDPVLLAGALCTVVPRQAQRSGSGGHAMRTRVIAAIALAASLAGCAVAPHFAQGTRPTPRWWQAYQSEALNALVEEGLAQSPALASAQATLKATHEALRVQIGDNLYPSVDLGFAPSRQRALTIPNLPQETFLYNVFALEAQASYRFDFFGATLYADRALALQVDQQSFQFDATRRALAANIVIATINAATLNEDLDATETLVSLAEQYAQQLAARERLGGVSHDEALVAEQNAATLAATLPALRAQLLAVRHAQAVLLGRSPDPAPAPLPLATLHLPEEVPVSVPSDLLHQRPDILAAEAGVRSAANQAGAAAALLYPSPPLSGGS